MRSDNLDSVSELYTEDDFRQLVVAIEATPAFLGSLGELDMAIPGQGRIERRLAAIPAADVAGYSRLMGADKEGTARALRGHRAGGSGRREILIPKRAFHSK